MNGDNASWLVERYHSQPVQHRLDALHEGLRPLGRWLKSWHGAAGASLSLSAGTLGQKPLQPQQAFFPRRWMCRSPAFSLTSAKQRAARIRLGLSALKKGPDAA